MEAGEPPSKVNKKAVLAFILSLVGLVVTPALLVAIVLWFLVRRDVRRDPNQRGFRLASVGLGLVLAVYIAVFGLLSAMALGLGGESIVRFASRFVENVFFSQAQARNEAHAIAAVETIRDSLNRFCRENGGYPGSLNELVNAGLLEPRYAQPLIGEYVFEYDLSYSERMSGRRTYSWFVVSAKPRVFYVGRRVFILIEKGSIGVIESRGSENVERVIPPPDDWSSCAAGATRKGQNEPSGDLLDLNTATAEQLEKLPGIGPTTAKAIVRFREKSGPFRRVEDLLAIRGITKKKLEKIRPLVTVKEVPKEPKSGRP